MGPPVRLSSRFELASLREDYACHSAAQAEFITAVVSLYGGNLLEAKETGREHESASGHDGEPADRGRCSYLGKCRPIASFGRGAGRRPGPDVSKLQWRRVGGEG